MWLAELGLRCRSKVHVGQEVWRTMNFIFQDQANSMSFTMLCKMAGRQTEPQSKSYRV